MAEKLTAIKGMNDILPPESARWEWLEDKVRQLMRRYGYQNMRTPIVEPTALFVRGLGEVTAIVEAVAREQGITRRVISSGEVLERTLLSLVNEGAKILAEGIALRAVDIDIIYVNGYGFPAWRGGCRSSPGAGATRPRVMRR